MAIASTTKLGPYEIVALIGAGGMGEVYRARDTRLGREVAIKVLPGSFAADPERLHRFEQEARAVAALNHPNILAIHDIGQHDSAPFIVSELLEGETLRELLRRGPPSHRRAVEYAVHIANGLAAAHSRNIAHRDLKPDNIFITRDGRVKILDFGLAKNVMKPAMHGQDAGLGTMTALAPATDVGTVVGTAGYMSPEQVRGEAVDCRTDIFSFGAVLYEMLTGHRAFQRDTTPETMTAILKDDPPDLMELDKPIAPALDRIVRHCLEKAPEQRFQSARDLAFDLESLPTLTGSARVTAAKVKHQRRWRHIAIAAATLVAVAALAGWALSSALRSPTSPQFRQLTYRRGTSEGNARYTPDGHNVIFTAAWDSPEPELYTVPASGVGGHPLGIKNARLLAISRHGEMAVALNPTVVFTFLRPGNLARTDGNSAPKPEIENVESADYTPDGSALAIVRYIPADQTCQVEYPIGKVLYRTASLASIESLRFSPNGRFLGFITHDNGSDDRGRAVIINTSGERVAEGPVFESSQGLAWTPSGDEVWTSSPLESGELHALARSGKTRTPLAVPGRLRLDDIGPSGDLLVEQGIARRGMVISSHDGDVLRDLSWLDFSYLRYISDDGKTVLFEEEGSSNQSYTVFVRDVDGSPALPIGQGYGITLSRDKHWALAARIGSPLELWLLPVGPGEPRRLTPPNVEPLVAGSFLSDGTRIVYIGREPGHDMRTWMQDLNGGAPQPITPEGIAGGQVSPDDKWVLLGRRLRGRVSNVDALIMPIPGGELKPVSGLRRGDQVLGWSNDDQLYVGSFDAKRVAYTIEKLNPFSGGRTSWRSISGPPISGILPDPPILTFDGTTFGFDYRMRLSDLYTVSGVR